MFRKSLFILFLLCIFSLKLFGQTINLEEVRTLALLNSRSLARSSLAIRNSLLEERNQFFSLLPSVSLNYSAGASYLDSEWNFVSPQDTFSSRAELDISYRIFDGGRRLLQRELSEISTESVRRDALAEYFNVLDAVDNAYYAVLEAAANLEAEESSLQTAIFSLTMAEIRQASGMINRGEYLRALADMEQRENSRNQARRNLALNITRLNSLIGIPGSFPELQAIDLTVYDALIQHLAGINDDEIYDLYQRLWLIVSTSNPSLARAALNSQRAEINHSLIGRDFVPVINANIFSYSLNYSQMNGFSTAPRGSISISGTIPIDFWVLNNRLERSRNNIESEAMNFANMQINMEIDLYSSLLNLVGLAGSVISSRRTLDYVEMNFEFVLERYRLLQSSISEMQDASTMLINNQNSYNRSVYGFLQSLSRLRSMGAFEDENRMMEILLGR